MKKLFFTFSICLLILCSCSSSDDDNSNNNPSSINPPTWIQGTWLAETISGSDLGFEFTADDFCFINGTITTCYKSQIEQFNNAGQNTIVNETITETEYSIEINYSSQQVNYEFEKISNTEIEWINDPLGDLSQTIFIKQ